MSYAPLIARIKPAKEGITVLHAPEVGIWHHKLREGQILQPGDSLGYLDILGHQRLLKAPPGITGSITRCSYKRGTMAAVSWGDPLVHVDSTLSAGTSTMDEASTGASPSSDTEGLVFVAPMSGRYYGRPRPTDPPFVTVGSVIETGRTVALIEVMKTFNRVIYNSSASDLPSPARILHIYPQEDQDIARDEPLFEVEPA